MDKTIMGRLGNRVGAVLFMGVFLFILFWRLPAPLSAQDQPDIVETVYVENVEIPVRVFEGRQPVGGLTKSDFELYLDGEKTMINGFFEARKKLNRQPEAGVPPRLFALIFNLSDFSQDLTAHLDTLFEKIIRPGDHLIVITNRYFFPEWIVENPEKTRGKIVDILEKEGNKLKAEMLRFENELRAIAIELKSRLADPYEKRADDNFPLGIFRNFFFTYRFVLEDIRNQYLNLPLDQYIKISEYLKGQQMEKWVLSFYQMGRLPLLDQSGQIQKSLDRYLDQEGPAVSTGNLETGNLPLNFKAARQKLTALHLDFTLKIHQIDELFVKDIARAFLNSGATVHTLLLKPLRQTSITGYNDYKYETVATDSENILKQMSRLTGGSIVNSNRIEDFIQDITQREDIVYMLTYAADSPKKKPPRVEIKIKNPGYRPVYDNHKRLKPFQDMMRQLQQGIRPIEIESITCSGDILTVKLKNIEMVQYEGERFGAVRARIKILDKGKKVIAGLEKTYKGIKEAGIIQAKLPPIDRGRYKVVLEVKDLFTIRNVYTGDAISFTKK
jgi:hypothetical protein